MDIMAISALSIAFAGAFIQGWRWLKELKDKNRISRDEATKATAERDSIIVNSAEAALKIAKDMLDLTRESNTELFGKVKTLEDLNRDKDAQIAKLHAEVQFLRLELAELKRQFGLTEHKEDRSQDGA